MANRYPKLFLMGWDGKAYFRKGSFGKKILGLRKLRRSSKVRGPEPVPAAMAGQYVAWSHDMLRIIGHGKTIAEARAMAGGERGDRMVIQKIPAVRRFIPDGIVRSAAAEAESREMPAEPAKA